MQAVQTGTNLPFLLRVLPAPCKNACWELSQTLLKTASAGCRLRVLAERFHPRTNKKNTPKADATSTFGVFYLPALLPGRLRCLICEESLDIFLCTQKALHDLDGFPRPQVDEDLRRRLETKLIISILGFDLN